MSFKPEIMVLDFETALLSGEPSTEYYREDFRAISAAFAWVGSDGTVRTRFRVGEPAIRQELDAIVKAGIKLVVHNFQFEYGVCLYRFPGCEVAVTYDTMRLVQVADNGGKLAQRYEVAVKTFDQLLDELEAEEESDTPKQTTGLALVSAASRWLGPEYQEHKKPFHAVIMERTGCKASDAGKNLNALTAEELERYNVADGVVTLALYLKLCESLAADGYDWSLDHLLYCGSARLIAQGKGDGIPADREELTAYATDIQKELDEIAAAFRAKFKEPIEQLEEEALIDWVNGPLTQRGKDNRAATSSVCDFAFNVGSNKQLAALFVGKLKMTPKFTTKTGQPSFKSAFLSQWGEGGELLKKRRKRLLVLKQCQSLLALTEYDGKWHVDLKACGTTTGRFAGGRA